MQPDVQTTQLGNGLRLTAISLPHLHTTSITAFVKVGSRFESAADNGLSHFVEHMLFRGTDGHPTSRELGIAIENLGSSLHAETGRDMSVYSLPIEPSATDGAMALLAEFLSRPRFSDIERERSIVLEEMAADYDEDGIEVNGDDIVRGLMFGDHPLAQRIIGPIGNVRRFSTDDVRRHFARHYTGSNTHVCVAGPTPIAEALDCARKYFAALPAGAPIPVAPPEALQLQERVHYKHVRDTGSQTSVCLLFRSIPDMAPDFHTSVALLRALDDGMSTPLHYQLCDQRGLAYEIGAGIEPLADVALFDISGATSQAKVPALIRGILELLTDFRERPVTDDDVTRIQRRYRFELAGILDDGLAMSSLLCGPALYYRPRSYQERLRGVADITAAGIQAAARTIFQPERLAVAVVGPLSRARQGEVRELVTSWR